MVLRSTERCGNGFASGAQAALDQAFKVTDHNGDNALDFEEFKSMYVTLSKNDKLSKLCRYSSKP
jgi:Ca2+-binding EF-hand superfamily protein